jgi:ABC-type glycerol-3-phosphate transport system substrate-binding protein
MKKVFFAIAAISLFAACGGNSNNSESSEDSLSYDQVKQQIDSTVTEEAPDVDVSYEEWQDGGELHFD